MSKDEKKPEARPEKKRDDSYYRLLEWPDWRKLGLVKLWTVERRTTAGKVERLRRPDTVELMQGKLHSCTMGFPPEQREWEEVKG